MGYVVRTLKNEISAHGTMARNNKTHNHMINHNSMNGEMQLGPKIL